MEKLSLIELKKKNITIGVSKKNSKYLGISAMPVICLDANKYVVLDIDSSYGLERFNKELSTNTLNKAIIAYVLTDKGVLLVTKKGTAMSIDYESDARYERISQENGKYAMNCVSKIHGSKRKMIATNSQAQSLADIWNTLAAYAENLGPWLFAVQEIQEFFEIPY